MSKLNTTKYSNQHLTKYNTSTQYTRMNAELEWRVGMLIDRYWLLINKNVKDP